MEQTSHQSEQNKVWDLIKDARTALLVTVGEDDALEARPMGCLQTAFDGTLWFLTFRHSSKLDQIGRDDRVLVVGQSREIRVCRGVGSGESRRRSTEAERALDRRIAGLVSKG